MTTWTCDGCQSTQTHELWCESCDRMRFLTREIALNEHIVEHLADGIEAPMDVLKAMQARPCYAGVSFTLANSTQRLRMLTRDTTKLAREIAKAKAAPMMLDIVHHGDTKDKIAVLKGIQVLGDVVEVKGETITRHVVELHEGPPPKRDGV